MEIVKQKIGKYCAFVRKLLDSAAEYQRRLCKKEERKIKAGKKNTLRRMQRDTLTSSLQQTLLSIDSCRPRKFNAHGHGKYAGYILPLLLSTSPPLYLSFSRTASHSIVSSSFLTCTFVSLCGMIKFLTCTQRDRRKRSGMDFQLRVVDATS